MSETDAGRVRLLVALTALLGVFVVGLIAVWLVGDADVPEGPVVERIRNPDPTLDPTPGPSFGGDDRRLPSPDPSPGSIAGRVFDPDDGPLSEGRINLHCEDGSLKAAVALAEDGTFTGPACATGSTCVRLSHPGVVQPRAWELEVGSVVELEVEAAPELTGTIVGPEGEHVPGAQLLVGSGEAPIATGSDAAGEFGVAIPQPRPCDRCDQECLDRASPAGPARPSGIGVLAWAAGYAPTERVVEPSESPIELVLGPAAPPITGTVVDRDGAPFDARTRVLATNPERAHEQHAALVDDRGQFVLDGLADAAYSLRAIRDEREIAMLADAQPGEQVELRSPFGDGSSLIVKITDAAGEPIAGVRVDGGPLRAATSDVDGRVTASAVLPGNYTLRVRASGCAVIREAIELEPNAGPWVREVQIPGSC